MAGPAMDAACLTYEGINIEVETFPRTKDDLWLLGKYYRLDEGDLHYLNNDIRTRLWFTYRKNFPNIGGTGPTTDSGWGCMLRCGQMMLAEALICRHLGRDWRWDPDEPRDQRYTQILQAFLDKKDSLYSLHQIAQMGVSEGKPVGSWFGPNTVVQVIKKLSAFDDWSGLSIHVAMDNTIIIEDIKGKAPTTVLANYCGYEYVDRVALRNTSRGNKACFTFRQSLGVIGGKPNHATYFIGYYGNNLLYLDPHSTQPTINPQEMISKN